MDAEVGQGAGRDGPRVLRGNKRDLPPGMGPLEWAGAVMNLMDAGLSEEAARAQVALTV